MKLASIATTLLMVVTLFGPPAARAAEEDTPKAKPDAAAAAATVPLTQYSRKGADSCIECHDADSDTDTFTMAGVFRGRHGQRHDARAPFGPKGLQCEACHGPGARHSLKGDKKFINSLKKDSFVPVAQRNDACLQCHKDDQRHAWAGSAHDSAGVACTDCHQLHTGRDRVAAKTSQAEVCYACHRQQRAEFQKASAHPVRQGRMSCTDCHNAHGSQAPAQLVHATLNQTCTSCHADKRGPVLWEHAPVAEDCASCHTPHGGPRAGLLTKTPPLLCQQCHESSGHPSVARTSAALPSQGGAGAAYLVAGACLNCHSQVHGSNHPAGAKLMR
jgi:DmsE family decaheme c-type cytochrome